MQDNEILFSSSPPEANIFNKFGAPDIILKNRICITFENTMKWLCPGWPDLVDDWFYVVKFRKKENTSFKHHRFDLISSCPNFKSIAYFLKVKREMIFNFRLILFYLKIDRIFIFDIHSDES